MIHAYREQYAEIIQHSIETYTMADGVTIEAKKKVLSDFAL